MVQVVVVKTARELSSHSLSPVKKFKIEPLPKLIISTNGKWQRVYQIYIYFVYPEGAVYISIHNSIP